MTFKLDATTMWVSAIQRWHAGDPQGVVNLLHRGGDIPAFAREFLARVATGDEKRMRGRKSAGMKTATTVGDVAREYLMRERYEVQRAIERARPRDGSIDETPKNRALEALADATGESPDAISRVVYPRKPRRRGG